jgi:hypothetical protein
MLRYYTITHLGQRIAKLVIKRRFHNVLSYFTLVLFHIEVPIVLQTNFDPIATSYKSRHMAILLTIALSEINGSLKKSSELRVEMIIIEMFEVQEEQLEEKLFMLAQGC